MYVNRKCVHPNLLTVDYNPRLSLKALGDCHDNMLYPPRFIVLVRKKKLLFYSCSLD